MVFSTTFAHIEVAYNHVRNVMVSGSYPALAHSEINTSLADFIRKASVNAFRSDYYLIISQLRSVEAKEEDEIIDIHFKDRDGLFHVRR